MHTKTRSDQARYYLGEELALFEQARQWKRYWTGLIHPYMRGEILEVGAGTGSTLPYLYRDVYQRWVCLEPDHTLLQQLRSRIQAAGWAHCTVRQDVLGALPPDELFDAILYIDVLEHIKEDRQEMQQAATHLKPGGNLIILSPAYQWLFSPFDARIGHYRRYTKRSLESLMPAPLAPVMVRHIDSWGMVASLANAMLLRQSLPTPGQLRFWDSVLVPLSRFTDAFMGYQVGKSVLGVWRRI
jgi:SAM-dependent methyltransferase